MTEGHVSFMADPTIAVANSAAIKELEAKKYKLEAEIAKLIEDFSDENGVTVEGISLEHDPVIMTQRGEVVNRIRYSIQLRVWV